MYRLTSRNALIRVFKEAPELVDLATRGEPPVPWSKLKDYRTRKLADRLLTELWMMGFAVSARKPTDRAPEGASRDPEKHKEWRNSKLPPPPKDNQKDVEQAVTEP